MYEGRGERMGQVRVRLVADTPDDLERAIIALVAALGDRVGFHRPGRRGRHDDWLAYGTLETSDGATGTPPATEGAGGAEGRWTR